MSFEGPEKKVEVIVDTKVPSLRNFGFPFWKSIVQSSRAEILSQISNSCVDAYLLSESSLFVSNDRFTMITCGKTNLAQSVQEFFKIVPVAHAQAVIYERKNEYFPHLQPSHFVDDISQFKTLMSGTAYQFGERDEHHLFLYHLKKEHQPRKQDRTLEILMYGIQGSAQKAYCEKNQKLEVIHKTGVRDLFEGFQCDDHQFPSMGYSLNAIKDRFYYTIHVTPEEMAPYVSFETNFFDLQKIEQSVQKVVSIFQPRSFDVIVFRPEGSTRLEFSQYPTKSHFEQRIEAGFNVYFGHFYSPSQEIRQARVLKESL